MKQKSLASLIIGGALGALAPETAVSQDTGPYVRMDVGPALSADLDLKEFFEVPVAGRKVKFDPGYRLGLAGGYRFTEWLGGELETGVIYSPVKSVTGAFAADMALWQVPVLGNVVFEYRNETALVPFIGGGAGFSVSTVDTERFRLGDTFVSGSSTDVVFAYQGFAGVRYDFNRNLGLSLFYKYLATTDPSWEPEWQFHTHGRMRLESPQTHSVSLALSYHF
jgi:opacity protein-like surface antigen